MKRHQVLTGAANQGEDCFGVGSIDGLHFTAYAAGCNIVILDSDFERLQIIPGSTYGNVQITCIDCSSGSGKIAGSYGKKVYIFVPTTRSESTNSILVGTKDEEHPYIFPRLDRQKLGKYKWVKASEISTECDVQALSWNQDGSRLLTGGNVIEMWQVVKPVSDEGSVQFFITDSKAEDRSSIESSPPPTWTCVWHARPASTLTLLKFSGDGLLFASAGTADRLVRVWYQQGKIKPGMIQSNRASPKKQEISYSFVLIAHPRAVTGFSWRRISKYIPKGSVANMLITSCKDNICRLWCETVLPNEELLDSNQGEFESGKPLGDLADLQKKQFTQRLHHVRHIASKRRKSTVGFGMQGAAAFGVGGLENKHDCHKFGVFPSNFTSGFHFHLAASINPETDIPLIPTLSGNSHGFVVHWLNNKELHFTAEAQHIAQDLMMSTSEFSEDDHRSQMSDLSERPGMPFWRKSEPMSFDKGQEDTLSNADTAERKFGPAGEHDSKIEQLLRDWHHSPDLLFSIHPVDGSFLVWLVDWLDEHDPGTFRQAQISFSTRIPNSLPKGDAMTMSSKVCLYSDHCYFGAASTIGNQNEENHDSSDRTSLTATKNSLTKDPIMPNLRLLTKHFNGSLNMWQVSFAEGSKFTALLNIAHSSRVSGHRFHTNNASCHPVMPLLLTTSHHNIPQSGPLFSVNSVSEGKSEDTNKSFCSELILWQVAAVGPLSKSGGLSELSRMSSPRTTAFTNVAWVPTLLPGSTLGLVSNSPSALFVAYDGCSLRAYQALIDARSLLYNKAKSTEQEGGMCASSTSSGGFPPMSSDVHSREGHVRIVSEQSTARPGCIIEHQPITDATGDWRNVQLMHIFQEQLVTGRKTPERKASGVTEAHNVIVFEEHFFLVVLQKAETGHSVLHMWKMMISSEVLEEHLDFSPDVVYSQEDAKDYRPQMGGSKQPDTASFEPRRLSVHSKKLCTQPLDLPVGVSVTSAVVAAGHLSSSSIYPACFAPYLLTTGCTDSTVCFWKCMVQTKDADDITVSWQAWEMISHTDAKSDILISARPVAISCAYSGRVAVAYCKSRKSVDQGSSKTIMYSVSVYECESTGGAEWSLEDTINLKGIKLESGESCEESRGLLAPHDVTSGGTVPQITVGDSSGQYKTLELDWVSTENGSHILTVCTGTKISFYTAVSSDVAAASKKDSKITVSQRVVQKHKAMTVQTAVEELQWICIRTITLKTADGLVAVPKHMSWVREGILVVGMENEMHVYSQWCAAFCEPEPETEVDQSDQRAVIENNLKSVLSSSNLQKGFKMSPSVSCIKTLSTASPQLKQEQTTKSSMSKGSSSETDLLSDMEMMQETGMFEIARRANPVLPQYHPKQLFELLNFGKMRQVKAILAHLVRCISGKKIVQTLQAGSSQVRHRTASVGVLLTGGAGIVSDTSTLPEEMNLDYLEIASIPPLPLYALINVDSSTYTSEYQSTSPLSSDGSGNIASTDSLSRDAQDYSKLFRVDQLEEDAFETEDQSLTDQDNKQMSSDRGVVHHFGPSAAALLAKHLTHTQLPGLSSLDQMYLMALADTVANTKLDFSDSVDHKVLDDGRLAKVSASTEQIDDCGLRYVLAARHYIYLLNTLPFRQRLKLQHSGLSPAYFIWAFHSESCEELLNVIPSVQKGEPTWQELKQFGAGWWIKNVDTLRKCIEKVAKHAFQDKQDPLDAAIFYLAMKKKNVLWGLFRSAGNSRMEQFFKNNFSEERWRKAALKNAFQLLGKQRFHHAAAFFLLAGAVRDAIEVCLNKLDDIQLCIVITRLYENEPNLQMPQNLKRLLYEECLGCDQHGNSYDPTTVHSDPFVRSMSYWIRKEYSTALDTLLDYEEKVFDEKREDVFSTNPTVFNFYNYLRSHPLVVRQKLTDNAGFSNQAMLLTGFPGSAQGYSSSKESSSVINQLSPIERRLFFKSAHSHFKSGCPMLALEVLSKLPEVIDMESYRDTDRGQAERCPDTTPQVQMETVNDLDWSQPVYKAEEEEFEVKWSDESDGETENEDIEPSIAETVELEADHTLHRDTASYTGVGDIMAHQLKFIACMKILMEELSTLATGFEVDGGQLRFQLYIWLEQEVEVLKKLCNYAQFTSSVTSELPENSKDSDDDHCQLTNLSVTHSKPTLHEIILAEKQDFEKKLTRAARRKTWLQVNQQLLRTFLSYSVLHGSGGGGLASVRMELILLLQELQQEKMQQQLLSPLPFPTTLPLLSACVASAKTVVADPVHHLQSVIEDLLYTVTEFRTPPNLNSPFTKVFTMRDISAALSACIYQSLCDSDSFIVAMSDYVNIGMEGFTSTDVVYRDSYLMAGANTRRRINSISEEIPNSEPVKWPGVSSLRNLVAKQQDEDCPRVHILLCESLLAVYMSLFIYALAMYECNVLYRLAAHAFSENMWATIFGGGMKKLVHIVTASEKGANEARDDLSKQRMKLHLKVLGPTGNKFSLKEDKPTYKEKFVPPQVSIVSYLMTKPYENPNDVGVDYDSTESFSSSDEDEDSDDQFKPRNGTGMSEHADTQSYSWSLMRYACVKYIRHRLTTFLPKIGLELPELPVCSPLMHRVLKCLENWELQTKAKLDLFSGPPVDYIPGCYMETTVDGSTILKYKALMDPINTPFTSSGPSAQSAKRLWHFLAKQEYLQEVFIRYIYKKSKIFTEHEKMKGGGFREMGQTPEAAMKIIHKEQEPITSFCMNQANLHCISIATQKEVIEMDIHSILNPPVWLEDETEYDIEDIKRPNDGTEPEEFLLVESPQDSHFMNAASMPPTAPGALPAPSTGTFAGHTGRGAGVLAKRKTEGIKRMGSHPNLPYYLSGGLDGSVQLWEWGHIPNIAVARQPGCFPKTTKVLFNAQGNKFGVTDGEGSLCLWQVGLGISMSKPYLSLKCHTRQTSDFVFVGSSSLLAAAGHSSDSQNVGLWDTLLPHQSALVQGFQCHNEGAPSILYAPQHQIILSGGKRGEVCIFDVRQRQLRHSFQAHESAVKCMALDPLEKYFVTGSADGDIKVWDLDIHNLIYCFTGEHIRGSLFRNTGSGVSNLSITPDGHLFSCGADGSLKVRHLQHKALTSSVLNSLSGSSVTTPSMERRFTLASLTEFNESSQLNSFTY